METKMIKMNQKEETNNRVRTILFAVAVAVVFFAWGARLYADNSINILPGESQEVTLENAVYEASPNGEEYMAVKAYIDGQACDEIQVEILEKHSANNFYSDGYIDKIKINVGADAQPGTYELRYVQNAFLSPRWEVDGSPSTFTVIGNGLGDEQNDGDTDTTKTDEISITKPKTAEEVYMDTLTQWYPQGFDIIKAGSSDCMNFLSTDAKTNSFYQAGVHMADFQFVTSDGTPRKMIMCNPKVIDGISYPSYWVNVNDGQDVTLLISDEQRKQLIAMGIKGIYLNEKLIML